MISAMDSGDRSPEAYGLKALNSPEGFQAIGIDGEVIF
jgi:hypothetical protein